MTNPIAAMRMLIIYAILIPLAMFVGYLVTNPMDYGTIGFLAFVGVLLISPIFIKWNYPILIFALGCPAYLFFLPGRPLMAQVVVVIALFIAVLERILSSGRRFIPAPVMAWPLLFVAAMAYMTAELTGGINLHFIGGAEGGGAKYIQLFTGIACFFAVTSQTIRPERRNFYLALFLLPTLLGILSDMFPFLPKPLNTINLLFPPGAGSVNQAGGHSIRLTALGKSVGILYIYLLARYGLRGTLDTRHPWRVIIAVGSFTLTMFGGFRNTFIGFFMLAGLLFFFERLYRTRLVLVVVFAGVIGATALVAFSNKLPYTFQRSLSFLPLKWDVEVTVDAEGSTEWRKQIWEATWPKVPDYLLLGKGYQLTKADFDLMGGGQFAGGSGAKFDAGEEGLAISSDFHNGPLSALIPFGIWGAIGILWVMAACGYVLFSNYKYGDPTLLAFNTFMLASWIGYVIFFFFFFGAFVDDVGWTYGKLAGFSLAMNGGLMRRPARAGYTAPLRQVAGPEITPQVV